MAETTATISTKSPISLCKTVHSHGWAWLAPWYWDDEKKCLQRLEQVAPLTIAKLDLRQKNDNAIHVDIESTATLARQEKQLLLSKLHRCFSLDWDNTEAISRAEQLDAKVATFLKQGGGRYLRGSCFFEDFIKTICTVNASWAYTTQMAKRFIDTLGNGCFPSPLEVLAAGAGVLQKQVRMGYRAEVVFNATRFLLENGVIDERGNVDPTTLSYDFLLQMRGIGPYAAAHTMVLLHDYSMLPVDCEVTAYCQKQLGLEAKQIVPHFEKWGDYKFLGYSIGRQLQR